MIVIQIVASTAMALHAFFSADGLPRIHGVPSSVIVSHDEGRVSVLFHRNYTVFKCLWVTPVTTTDKVDLFRSAIQWLDEYNVTLTSDLFELDDVNAWNEV